MVRPRAWSLSLKQFIRKNNVKKDTNRSLLHMIKTGWCFLRFFFCFPSLIFTWFFFFHLRVTLTNLPKGNSFISQSGFFPIFYIFYAWNLDVGRGSFINTSNWDNSADIRVMLVAVVVIAASAVKRNRPSRLNASV